MLLADVLCFVIASVAAIVLTWTVRRYALARGMMDLPNTRSSHTRPTPRGGGIAVVLTIQVGACVLAYFHWFDRAVLAALIVGGGAVALLGYIDDRKGLSAAPRALVHLAVAVVTVAFILPSGGSPGILAGMPQVALGFMAIVGIAWCINLFNFMDGIDGIAGSQAVFVSCASAVIAARSDAPEWSLVPALTAGAGAGFLVWNWPPAKIFMGDVGSGFLGFWLATVAIALAQAGVLNLWSSVILGALFIADTGVTLVRRYSSGQKWYEAHRSHAYQRLARRLRGHSPVTAGAWVVNLTIALPAAYVAQERQPFAPYLAAAVVLSFSAACAALGAGKATDNLPQKNVKQG
jgi:Fuc2NAc and GlcNAc transferase